jgi:hypothetical protein
MKSAVYPANSFQVPFAQVAYLDIAVLVRGAYRATVTVGAREACDGLGRGDGRLCDRRPIGSPSARLPIPSKVEQVRQRSQIVERHRSAKAIDGLSDQLVLLHPHRRNGTALLENDEVEHAT